MSEKPILFNTAMVRAILNGRKTQTRRVVVPHYRDGDAEFNVITNAATGKFLYIEYYDEYESSTERRLNPPYVPGDVLYVRETWKQYTTGTAGPGLIDGYLYKADEPQDTTGMMVEGHWHPSIHMPRDAARIFLRVTNIRAERLRSITEKDAMAEGYPILLSDIGFSATDWFRVTWDDNIADESTNWNANHWVWVYEFERIKL
ncbi:MAG: hypothetical protein IKJ45_02740 [Kiritimatiellae bacterium]|nr:hypothetical protein [Kiritimatiellia bacterium]